MTPKPTIEALRRDEQLLRQTAGKVLCEKPWKHKWMPDEINRRGTRFTLSRLNWHCAKPGCKAKGKLDGNLKNICIPAILDKYWGKPCHVPDPAAGPLESIAHKLIRQCNTPDRRAALCRATLAYAKIPPAANADDEDRVHCDAWNYLVFCESAVCAALALAGLGKARLEQ